VYNCVIRIETTKWESCRTAIWK